MLSLLSTKGGSQKRLLFGSKPWKINPVHVKPGLHICRKDRKHMLWSSYSFNDRSYIHISQEIFAIDMLTVLKTSLEHDRKHVLRLLRL